MPANTKQSKQVYLTLKPGEISARGRPQPGRASEIGVDEIMYTTEIGKENNGISNTLSSFEHGGRLLTNGGSDAGVIENFQSKPVYINLKTPEKQDMANGKSFQMEGDSLDGWNLLEALKKLSPLRRRKAQQDMWIEEETGQRAAFQNEVELNVTSNMNENPGSGNYGGESRRSEVFINLGSPTTATPGEAHPHTVNEGLLVPSINTFEELQSRSWREFMESCNSQTTVLVNYDLGNSSAEIAPPSKEGKELLEDADNDVALKDYIFYVQVKDGDVDVNPGNSAGMQNIVTLQTENYCEEANVITLGDKKLIDQVEGDQGSSEMILSGSDSEGGLPIASSDEGDNSIALSRVQVSQPSVVLSSQGNDEKESELYAGMLEDKVDSGREADDMKDRDERQQEQYLSVKDADRLRSSSWISLDNVHVTRQDAEVLSSPYPDSQQVDYTKVERIVQPVKSKPLFITLKPASGNVGDIDTSVDSEEISLLPSLQEVGEDANGEDRAYDGCGIDVRSEYEKTGTADIEQVELVSQTLPEMKLFADVDTDGTSDFVNEREDDEVQDMVRQFKHDINRNEDVENEESNDYTDEVEENELEKGQEMKHTEINIKLKSQNEQIDEEVHMISQPEEETEVCGGETKEFADGSCGREEDKMERRQEMKQSGITITLESQVEQIHEEGEMVCQSEQVTEVYEEVGRDEMEEFADKREENEVEMKQELKQTGVTIILKPPTRHIQQEAEVFENVLDTDQTQEFSVNKGKIEVAREQKMQRTGAVHITLKSRNRPSYEEVDLRQESKDGQRIDLKEQGRAVDEEGELDEVLTGDENDGKLLGDDENQQSLVKEVDAVNQSSDGSVKDYFGFPSRAEYLRSKISKVMKSNVEECVDKRSIVYEKRQETQVGTIKSERVKELLKRLGRDGELIKEVTPRQISENESLGDCSSASVDTDHTRMQTSCITFTLRPVIEQQPGDVMVSSIIDGDNREMTSHQSKDDHGMEGMQHSQCLDFNNDVGYEDHDGVQTSKVSLNLQRHIDQPVEEAVVDLRRVEDDMQMALEQMADVRVVEVLQNSYCLDLNNVTGVEESVESSSLGEVASVLMTESGSYQNDDSTLVPEMMGDGRQTWKGAGDNVKSETVYIRLKTSNEKQLPPAYLLSGTHAGSDETDEMSQKDGVKVSSKSPSKLKMLEVGVKKRLEQFGEHAAGMVGDIAQSSKELAKAVVRKGKNTPAHPELREVVLSRLRSRENGDTNGETSSMEENDIAGRKIRRVKSLFTPEEQLTLAGAADHVDATSMMEMMSSLVPDLASRVRGAEFEDDVREQVMKIVDALKEWKPTLNRGKSKTDEGERERHGLSETEESCRQEFADESQAVGGDEITNSRIVEALMRLKLSKDKGEVETEEEALESSGILDVFKMMDKQFEDKGAEIQEASLKVKEALMGLKPRSWDKSEDDDMLKMKDMLMKLKPDFILREIESMADGVEKLQLSETLKNLVPDFSLGRHEDIQEGDGDSEMAKVIGMLKKLKPNLDSANLGTDEDTSVMETLKRLSIAPRLQDLKKDLQVRPSSLATEALGTVKSVLAESRERATLTVDEFSRMRDALGTLLPHWNREHGDVEEESSSAITEALLSLKPNLSGGKGDGENSKMKDFLLKLAAGKGKGNSDSNELECHEEKLGMMQALRDMIAPRRPGDIELKVQEAEEDTPEDGVDALTYQKDKSFESRETDWGKVGKLLKNLLTFGAFNEKDNRVMLFLSDDENEGLVVAKRATDITESRVKEAMLKLKSLDGNDEESKMSSLKKSGWLRALIDFMVLGDDIRYQSLPSDEVSTAIQMEEVETLPGTSKDEGAIVQETSVEASPIPSPIDHFKAREVLQSLDQSTEGTNQGRSTYHGPWKIFSMSRILKKKDGDSADDLAEREINGERGKNGGLMKGIDIVGLAHPYISKRRHSSLSSRELKDINGKAGHVVKGRPERQDENVYLTFKMTYLSGFSPVSSRNVIVHDAAVYQKCMCNSFPFTFAIRNYVMSDADIARNSADGDGFLIISGDGDASLDVEVQEDIVAVKVGDEEEKSGREEVNMDELADMLNGDDVQAEQENEEEPEPEPEGEVVTEEHIAEVKVGGVEAGISIQWPGGEEEQTEEAAAAADNDETEKVEETEEVGEAEKIEEAENVEVIEEAENVEVGEDEAEAVEDTPKQEELLIDVQVNGEATEEINEETKDEVNVDEVNVVEVNVDEVNVDEVNVEEEPEAPAEEVVEDTKQEDESPAGNVAIEITLGEKAEEKKEEKEEVTEKVPHVRHGRVAKNLSDRIRAFESKNKENEPVISHSKRSTAKLDNTKIIKYQGSIDEADGEPVKPAVKGTGRLDMSRFSLFQKKSAGSEPPKKNFTIKPVVNKNRFGSQDGDDDNDDAEIKGPSSTDASNKCLACEKRVYPMEKVTADGKTYHKSCFRCTECKKVLSVGTYAAINSLIFCKPHFKQRFKMYGDYTTGFSKGSNLKSPSTADGFEFSDKTGAMDEIAATQAQTTESTPVVRDDLVRSSDTLDDKKSVEGGTKSILERFKQGPVSNVEIKRTIDEEHVSVRSLENYEPPPREEEEDTHVKPQDMIDTDRDAGQSAESQPQEAREDVVRSNQDSEEVRPSVGLKNLKSMFEKGGVSNVEVRVQREKIEVKPLGEAEDTEAKAVAENVPQGQKADVVSGGSQEEDPGIKLGLAQKIRAQFEKGNVSNIEEKPRPDLERTPKSLDDYADEQSAQGAQSVSESTPQRRDDVVRSDIPLEEQSHLAEGTRSLLSKWEKGEVEHAEEKPKESLSEPKDFKDVIQVSESTPQVRDDLVRETDQLDESIPEGFAKNLAGNLEGGAEFSVEVGVRESVEDEESNRIAEGDDNPEIQVSVEVNGNVSPGENGLESTLNGHYENDVESPDADPSLEIKAARAAALEQDEDDATMMVDSR